MEHFLSGVLKVLTHRQTGFINILCMPIAVVDGTYQLCLVHVAAAFGWQASKFCYFAKFCIYIKFSA